MRSRRLARIGVCACWVGIPPALAAPVGADPVDAREWSVVPVSAGSESVVRLGDYDDLVVLDATDVAVEALGGGLVKVVAGRTGRADVLVASADGARVVSFRVVSASADGAPRSAARRIASGSDQGSLGLFGDLSLMGGRAPTTWRFRQGASWHQASERFEGDAYVVAAQGSNQPLHVSDLALIADVGAITVGIGDVAGADPVGDALIRGLSVAWRPAGSAATVTLGGGALRDLSCCAFLRPNDLVVGGASVQWNGPGRYFGAAGLGVATSPRVEATVPVSRVLLGYDGAGLDLGAEVEQSGPGARVRSWIDWNGVQGGHASLSGEMTTTGYRRLPFTRIPSPTYRAQARTTIELLPSVQVLSTLYAMSTAMSRNTHGSGGVGGTATLAAKLARGVGTSVHYRKTAYLSEVASSRSSALLQVNLAPSARIGIMTGGGMSSEDAKLSRVFGRGRVRVSPAPGWNVGLGGDVGVTLATGQLTPGGLFDVSGTRDAWRGLARWVVGPAGGPGAGLRHRADVNVGWSPLPALSIGAQGGLGSSGSGVDWSVGSSWSLNTDLFGRSRGGLGFGGRVEGYVFRDVDRDGVRDADEPPAPGVEVVLDDRRSATTDAKGRYRIRTVRAGSHLVSVTVEGERVAGGARTEVEVKPLKTTARDFALSPAGRVIGVVYTDVDGDGVYGDGDRAVAAEQVTLRDVDGVLVQTGLVSGGTFDLQGVAPGTYRVSLDPFGLPAGYRPIDPVDQDVVVGIDRPTRVGFRLESERSISGTVYRDLDGDGLRGSGDPPVADVEVRLSTGQVLRTDGQGRFLFRSLAAGQVELSTAGAPVRTVELGAGPGQLARQDLLLPGEAAIVAPPAPGAPPAPALAALLLTPTISAIPSGLSTTLLASALRADGSRAPVGDRVVWSTSDPAVATVDATGKVTGVGPGRADIIADLDGLRRTSQSILVLHDVLTLVEMVPVEINVAPGDTVAVRVLATDDLGARGDVTMFATLESQAPGVLRLDGADAVAVHEGEGFVTASVVGVEAKPVPVRVGRSPYTQLTARRMPPRMPPGARVRLEALGYRADLGVADLSEKVSWTSSDEAVARIVDGYVEAVKPGEARLVARLDGLEAPPVRILVSTVPPRRLTLDATTVELTVGQEARLTATAAFEVGEGDVSAVVTWEVTGRGVTVSPEGVLLGVAAGTATVRATFNGVSTDPVEVLVRP